ncbi:primosomal protein N' [Myxococcota bacterium]|nr:primosomal protein N' [Myxococcota bacterium]
MSIEVAVPVPLRRTFHYAPPPEDPQPQPGARVLVRFAHRKLIGYALSVDAPPPPGVRLSPIIEVIDDAPLFSPTLLAFLRWIAEYYHAPIGEVLRAAHPPGTSGKGVWVLRITKKSRTVKGKLPHALQRALDAIAMAGGALPPEALDPRPSDARLRQWAAEGWIEREQIVEGPKVEVRNERALRATRPPPEAPRGPGGRALKRDEIHAWLALRGCTRTSLIHEAFKNAGPHLRQLIEEGAAVEERVEVLRDPFFGEPVARDTPPTLTAQQRAAVEAISAARGFAGFLLHGVTGSGKTEVYLSVIADALARGLSALVLVPEIALTPQLVRRFRARLGDAIAVLHSGLSAGARFDEWRRIHRGDVRVIIGARSGVFAPVEGLGLIIVDEEHDPSFKQGDGVRYQGRDMALARGLREGAVVVLGSATPSMESVHNVAQGKLQRLLLTERPTQSGLPVVDLVDLRDQPPTPDEPLFSPPLREALTRTLARGEQAILFLNRRGYSNVVLCASCGEVLHCPNCAISMTWHAHNRQLRCHYCDLIRPRPEICPRCRGTKLEIPGQGTERVEESLRRLYPNARVARMDRDTATGRKLETLIAQMREGELDILVGTQMVTKGHDFPKVTCVGVLAADAALKFPDFRSAERTFQLLTQVAGRAGRADRPGRVLIQTWDPQHFCLQSVAAHDTEGFAQQELVWRRVQGYPPFHYAVSFRFQGVDAEEVARLARATTQVIEVAGANDLTWRVRGPAPAPIERLRRRARWAMLLTATHRPILHRLVEAVLTADLDSAGEASLIVDVDPYDFL